MDRQNSSRTARRYFHSALVWLVLLAIGLPSAWSQGPADQKTTLKIPDRERLTLTTKDGVQLSCQYYPGGYAKMGETITEIDGKQVVPVILVHGWGGRSSDYDQFAIGLQSMGYAVVVPDLRGHGQSTILNTAAGPTEIVFDKLKPRDASLMWHDIEAVKRFLLQKNNEGELNIELLGIVGASEGALVAMNWAVVDWSKRQLPAFKQGCDVKLIIALSPPAKFGALRLQAPASHAVVSRLPCMLAVGSRDEMGLRDADQLYKVLERRHPNPDETLRFVEADTELRGALLLQEDLPVAYEAARFLHTMLFERAGEFPWKNRPDPLGSTRE